MARSVKDLKIDMAIDEFVIYTKVLEGKIDKNNKQGTATQEAFRGDIQKGISNLKVLGTVEVAGQANVAAAQWIAKNTNDFLHKTDSVSTSMLNFSKKMEKGADEFEKKAYQFKGQLDKIKDFLELFQGDKSSPESKLISKWKDKYEKDQKAEYEKWSPKVVKKTTAAKGSTSNDVGDNDTSISEIKDNYASLQEQINEWRMNGSKDQENPEEDTDNKEPEKKETVSEKISGWLQNDSKIMRNQPTRNPFLKALWESGPDLYSNMFDIALCFMQRDEDGVAEKNFDMVKFFPSSLNGQGQQKFPQVLQDTFGHTYAISVRTASVNLPKFINETFDINFLNTKIQKASSTRSMALEGTLSIDTDANTYVNDMFMGLAGLRRKGTYLDGMSIKDNKFDIQAVYVGRRVSTIDMYVSAHSLSCWQNYMFDSKLKPGKPDSKILFVFEDVRFKGVESGLPFGADKGMASTDVGFIFKRLRTIYKQPITEDNPTYEYDTRLSFNGGLNGRKEKGFIYDEDTIWQKEN